MTQKEMFGGGGKKEDNFIPRTKGGYELRDAASALIKEIRRGNEEEAFFWCWELSKSFPNYIWKRLLICAVEDVGLADPNVIVQLNALANAWHLCRTWQKKGTIEEDFMAQAVLVLCRAPKSREVDDFKNHCMEQFYKDRDKGVRKSVPQYALDGHTSEGKKKGFSDVDWWHDVHQPEQGGTNKYSQGCLEFCKRLDNKK